MSKTRTLRHVAVALLLLVAFLFQGTWALAGTTGSISGVVTDEAGAPVAGAAVKVVSASQSASATTDAGGHFAFISLAPDTYTVSIEKDGFTPQSTAGVTVFADQQQTLSFRLSKALKTIAKITSTAAGSLVKSGTTADVYSVNPATAAQVASNGGGLNIDSAYASVYAQPGVSSFVGNFGVNQVFYIRGSAYSQVGYEFDGIPVNRAFDNYNSSSLSNLGNAEVEVYTGGSPASAASNTLAGYVNQVIRTGTYPGFGSLSGAIGTPSFYHKLDAEAGGATPDRRFSWYVGLRGADSQVNFFNGNNGASWNPDGNNPAYFQGNSFNPALNLSQYFGTFGWNAGPWPDCTPSGAAPAGAPVTSATNVLLGLGGASSFCNYYQPVGGAVQGFNGGLVLADRENVINFHFGIPHKKDGGRDDVQVLFDNFAYHQTAMDNIGNAGSLNWFQNAYSQFAGPASSLQTAYAYNYGAPLSGYPEYQGTTYDGLCQWLAFSSGGCATTGYSPFQYQDNTQPSAAFMAPASSMAFSTYYFPNSNTNRQPFSGIPTNLASGILNDGAILKLQYQKNFGSAAYARLYGYTFYSDWLQSDPNAAIGAFGFGGADSTDYELTTHTAGAALQIADQINERHLLTFNANYVTSKPVRWNNLEGSVNPAGFAGVMAWNGTNCVSVRSNTSGAKVLDASYPAALPIGSPVSCYSYLAGDTLGNAQAQALPAAPAGSSWVAGMNLQTYGSRNAVQPVFDNFSLNDEFRPNDKLNLDLGVRVESYKYNFFTGNDASNTFWVNQLNATACIDPNGLLQKWQKNLGSVASTVPTTTDPIWSSHLVTTAPGGACPANPRDVVNGVAAATYHPGTNGIPLISVASTPSLTKNTASLRFSGTYTVNPDSVVRFSYGRYVQPTETAFEQVSPAGYLDGYENAAHILTSGYWTYGFSSGVHDNPLQYSNNADLSLEHHLKGTDWSYKISPFYRYTSQQLITVVAGGGLAGGFNAGTQRTSGIELSIQKGDPTRDGWSGQFNYTRTNAKLKYSLINGVSGITAMQANLKAFWGLTKNGGGAPCYATALNGSAPQTAAACTADAASATPQFVTNPYYNMLSNVTSTAQLYSDFPTDGWYPVYANYFPGTFVGGSINGLDQTTAFGPDEFAGYIAFKHHKLQASVNYQLQSGAYYGSPVDFVGLDPRSCYGNESQAGVGVSSSYGQNGDYQTCTGQVAMPNPATGSFTKVGQYQDPWTLNIGAAFHYELSPRITASLDLANVIQRCFGGTSTPWSAAFSPSRYVCGYAANGLSYVGSVPGAGYFYGASGHDAVNGTAGYPGVYDQPYVPSVQTSALPLQAYFSLQIKL